MITRNKICTRRLFPAMLAVLFCASFSWAQQLSIESPSPGTIFSAGQTMNVTVSVTNGSVLAVQVFGQGMGTTAFQSAAPFTFMLTAPSNVIGPQNLLAIGALGQGDAVISPTVAVDIEPASAPAAIAFNESLATLGYVGDQRRVGVTATFADGSTQDVSNSTKLTYSSSASTVTSIDSTGLMTCQGIGSATITATYGTLTTTLQTQGPSGVPGDLNGDFVVNSDDLALLELSLGATPTLPGDGRNLDGDAMIDAGDVKDLLAICGSACPSLTTTTTALAGIPAQIAYAQPLQLTAMVTGSGTAKPTGGVAFLVDGKVQDVGALVSPNEAYVTLASLAAGSHTIDAMYEGDTSNAPSTSASVTTQVLAPVLAYIDVLPASPTVGPGATQQFTAIGSYTDASTQNQTTSATWTSQTPSVATIGASTGLATAVGPGTAQIAATLNGITSPADTLTVGAPLPTLATLSPTSVIAGTGGFTLTVNGTNFISGSVVNFNGVAQTTTYVSATQLTAAIPASAITTAGAVPVTVTTAAPGGGTSSAVSFTVNAAPVPTFTLSSSTAPQTVQPGGSAQYNVTIAAQNGTFAGSVALAASGLPTGATATFSPASASPGSSSVTSQLTIQTSASTAQLVRTGSSWPLVASILPLLGLCFIGAGRRRWLALCLVLMSSLGVVASLTGCGGSSGSSNKTSPQTYTITVTGTSGTEIQTATVQLTVQ
jgi:Bacterial Ig-like domain (group 3)/Bacterial Ig-like domain (group 2)